MGARSPQLPKAQGAPFPVYIPIWGSIVDLASVLLSTAPSLTAARLPLPLGRSEPRCNRPLLHIPTCGTLPPLQAAARMACQPDDRKPASMYPRWRSPTASQLSRKASCGAASPCCSRALARRLWQRVSNRGGGTLQPSNPKRSMYAKGRLLRVSDAPVRTSKKSE